MSIGPYPDHGHSVHEQPTTPIEEPFEVTTQEGETVMVTPLDIAKAVETELMTAPNDSIRDNVSRLPILRRLSLAMSALTAEEKELISPEARKQVTAFSVKLAKAAKAAGRTTLR